MVPVEERPYFYEIAEIFEASFIGRLFSPEIFIEVTWRTERARLNKQRFG